MRVRLGKRRIVEGLHMGCELLTGVRVVFFGLRTKQRRGGSVEGVLAGFSMSPGLLLVWANCLFI